MAKLFTPNEQELIDPKKIKSIWDFKFSLVIPLVIIVVFIAIVKKREIDKKNKIMNLVELLVMDNDNILTQKVKYITSQKIDPKDVSEIFFEVVSGNENFEKGDLVKFNHRFIQEEQIENVTYCLIQANQVHFHLKSKDVKKDILKK